MRVITYDIPENRTRTGVHKLLKGYLNHVQYSVFEGELSQKQCSEAVDKIKRIINENEDSVRVYSLCASCIRRTEIVGTGKIYTDEGYFII
ncbi:MAG: CRISPR-associated endonuclease Cas2 [Actinobacteria bacterium]|nr:CRISPR-associated endonuclease Cas2 [Actinomycetota bacterium]